MDGQAAADRDAVYVVGHDRHLYGLDAARATGGGRATRGGTRHRPRRGSGCSPAVPTATCGPSTPAPGPSGGEVGRCTPARRARRAPTTGSPPPVVAGGVVALVGDPSSADGALLSALDADTGATIWQRPAGKPSTAVRGCRLVAAGDCLVLRDDRGVVALDAHSGSELWRVESLANTDLALRGAAVLCLGWRGLDAYDVVDGRRLWRRPLTVDRSSARVAAGAAAVVVSDRRRLVVLDPDTGEGPPGVT